MKPIIAILLTFAICGAEEFHPVTHRRIAQVMSADGADWLVRPERKAMSGRIRRSMRSACSGSTVADIGAGVGYFTWRLAARVGTGGVVYGEDIQQRMLDQLTKNMTRGI